VSTLRGATVQINRRRAGRIAVDVSLLALVALVAGLLLAGLHKNSQINQLRNRGVPVSVTVTGCLAQLSGSGSNVAGYMCTGTLTLEGHHYREIIGGTTSFHPTGGTVRAVAVPGDPSFLSTARAVSSERASFNVFIVPTILLVILLLLVGLLVWRSRARTRAADDRR
jgi:hypothetical protein